MAYQIIYTKNYNKKASVFLKKYPKLVNQYRKTLALLELNPFHPSLRLHRLTGKLKALHSVSINMSYRITLEFMLDENKIIPLEIGNHHQVYN